MHDFSFHRVCCLSRMRSSWNAEFLPDVDPVRVFENVTVGVENFLVQVAIPIVLLGNLPQGFPFLDFVPLCGIKGVGAALAFLFFRLGTNIGYCPGIFFLHHKISPSLGPSLSKAASEPLLEQLLSASSPSQQFPVFDSIRFQVIKFPFYSAKVLRPPAQRSTHAPILSPLHNQLGAPVFRSA